MSSTHGSEQHPTHDTEQGTASAQGGDVPARTEADWQRKRRLAEIFGDVLPSTTRDERDPGTTGGSRRSAQDEWLLSQVPPHHGGHG